jgi:hypothetical protein
MIIEHQFKTKSHDLVALFDKTNKMSTFKNKVERQANQNTQDYPYNDYVGDAFEFLVELIIKLHPVDNRLGITKYTPIQSNDNGVDGYGINADGNKCAIQVKFRSDVTTNLSATKDHLDSFIVESLSNNIIPLGKQEKGYPKHYIFTTAEGLHHYTETEKWKAFNIHVIKWSTLRNMLDNNYLFWDKCREIIKDLAA